METSKTNLTVHLVIFSLLLLVGTLGFMAVEGFSLTDAVYFSIVTMATVGYGDIHPQSAAGKLLALVIIVGGVGTFLGVVASITDVFLNRREEGIRRQKLNMVTGLFFSEIGSRLLNFLVPLDEEVEELHGFLSVTAGWTDKDFEVAQEKLGKHRFVIDSKKGDMEELHLFLQSKADFLLRLIENPVIHEHGKFADLLRAIFHLRDELTNRTLLSEVPPADRKHLEGDMVRIYKLLAIEWLRHMHYLRDHYGYLFSLAMRVNPFNPQADAVVTT